MNPIRKWNRFAAVGCSHGNHIDPVAKDSVIDFAKSFKPHKFIHLGDFLDMEAFMGGGNGQGEPVAPDIEAGLQFLEEANFNVILGGNHEARLWELQHSNNEIVAECSTRIIKDIEGTAKKLNAELIPYTGIFQEYRLGDGLFTHGTIYNENCCRDMAEMYCKNGVRVTMFAHWHRVGYAKGRRDDNPTGICVGTLTKRGTSCNMSYSHRRRSSMAWSQGIVYGEYSEDTIIPFVYEHPMALMGQKWRINA
jgi:hypothetical protein